MGEKSVELMQALMLTAEVCGSSLSDAAAKIMAIDLSQYAHEEVLKALVRCRREGKGRLSLASIIERINDGWLEPDVALGVALKCSEGDEAQIVCDELMAAWGDASPALEVGDKFAFRQTFLSSYKRRRDDARSEGRAPKWWISGSVNRMQVITDGVRRGLLPPVFLEQLPAPEDFPRIDSACDPVSGKFSVVAKR